MLCEVLHCKSSQLLNFPYVPGLLKRKLPRSLAKYPIGHNGCSDGSEIPINNGL
jgi:hypothetical protein